MKDWGIGYNNVFSMRDWGIGFIVKSTYHIRLYQPNIYYIKKEFLNTVLILLSWRGICASDNIFVLPDVSLTHQNIYI